MGRPNETKSKMRIIKEKEEIVKKYLSGKLATILTKKYDLSNKIIYRWINNYQNDGLNGLNSNTRR